MVRFCKWMHQLMGTQTIQIRQSMPLEWQRCGSLKIQSKKVGAINHQDWNRLGHQWQFKTKPDRCAQRNFGLGECLAQCVSDLDLARGKFDQRILKCRRRKGTRDWAFKWIRMGRKFWRKRAAFHQTVSHSIFHQLANQSTFHQLTIRQHSTNRAIRTQTWESLIRKLGTLRCQRVSFTWDRCTSRRCLISF